MGGRGCSRYPGGGAEAWSECPQVWQCVTKCEIVFVRGGVHNNYLWGGAEAWSGVPTGVAKFEIVFVREGGPTSTCVVTQLCVVEALLRSFAC